MVENGEICIYCNNTGRTYDNPDKCDHCGRTYQRGIDAYEELSFYIPPSLTSLVKNWSPLNVKNFVRERNGNVLPRTQNVLETLDSITFDCKEQIIFNISIYNYNIILNSWSAHIFKKFGKLYSNVDAVIFNPLLLDDIFILKDSPIVILELVEYDWEKQIQKVMALISIRKRLGKPTIVFSNCRSMTKYLEKHCIYNYSVTGQTIDIMKTDDLENPFLYINDL